MPVCLQATIYAICQSNVPMYNHKRCFVGFLLVNFAKNLLLKSYIVISSSAYLEELLQFEQPM